MRKEIKDYLHLYLGCNYIADYPTNPSSPEMLTGKVYDVIIATTSDHLACNSKYIKLILRPLSDFKEEDFYSFFEQRENEVMVKATINKYWCCGFYDKQEYQERIEEELPVNDIDLLIDLEEADFSNVWSVSKTGNDLAYGTDEEMRYFIGLENLAAWVNHLRKRWIDCDGLIKAGLAIDKTTLKQ